VGEYSRKRSAGAPALTESQQALEEMRLLNENLAWLREYAEEHEIGECVNTIADACEKISDVEPDKDGKPFDWGAIASVFGQIVDVAKSRATTRPT
jgi:hypothetical protein